MVKNNIIPRFKPQRVDMVDGVVAAVEVVVGAVGVSARVALDEPA
jgi:hypothetical protein